MQGGNRLQKLSFFQKVRPETIEALWQKGEVRQFPKGRILVRAREEMHLVCFQMSGKSMIYHLTHTGKRKVIFILGEGALLNEHIMNEHPPSLFCETLEESKIFLVEDSFFLACMESDFGLTRAVLETQDCRVWRMGHQLKNTTAGIYMERKLAAKLWKLARDFGIQRPEGVEIDVQLPVTLLADMLGASREATSRLCGSLVEKGLIIIHKKRIIITNPEKMSLFYKTGKLE